MIKTLYVHSAVMNIYVESKIQSPPPVASTLSGQERGDKHKQNKQFNIPLRFTSGKV